MSTRRTSVAPINLKDSRKQLTLARIRLRQEVSTYRDLVFVHTTPGTKLTPNQKVAVEEALRGALDIIALHAEAYARAVIEVRAAAESRK